MQNYSFLTDMYRDAYFPNFLVDKIKALLIELCVDLESEANKSEENQLGLIKNFIDRINELQEEFYENNSEIETAARESILGDVEFIIRKYEVKCDFEEATGHRDW